MVQLNGSALRWVNQNVLFLHTCVSKPSVIMSNSFFVSSVEMIMSKSLFEIDVKKKLINQHQLYYMYMVLDPFPC